MKKMGKVRTPARVVILFLFFLAVLFPYSPASAEMKEVALDFDDVDIRLFIRVISELTGKNFIIDNKVRGKVTVLSPKKLTAGQAYEVFKSVLAVNGFTVVQAGEIAKIVPVSDMGRYELPLSTRKVLRGEDQYITQIMPLKYLDAKTILPLMKPLLSRQATIFAPPSSDLLVVTDYKSNIRKIDQLLDEIDIEISDVTIEKLDLKYSSAEVISSKITQILKGNTVRPERGPRPYSSRSYP